MMPINVRTAIIALLATVWATLQPSAALDQAAANALASHLLTQLGKTRGVAAVARCGNGTLALALLQASDLLVHATDPDQADVNAARSLAEPTGLVGTRFYVERAAAAPLVLADNTVDLLVMFDLRDADLAGIPFDAVQAALCPGGRAFVGRASAEGAGLSGAALQSWISGKSGASVVTDAQGTWAVITRSDPPGVDIWTHRFHGPDNNPASTDAVVQFPFLLQYRIKPYQNGRYGSVVTSNGRMFVVFNDQSSWPTYRRYLRAYNIYNGQTLWNRSLTNDWPSAMDRSDPDVYPSSYSCVVARGDDLYLLKGTGVLRLAGATGQELGTITFGSGTERVKWIAIAGDLLYALVGDSALVEAGAFYGTTVKTYNLTTSSMGWSQAEAGRIDNREIAISNGRIFYYVKGVRVVCRNAATGSQLWENTAVAATLDGHGSNTTALTFCVGGHDGMLASQWGVYLCSAEDQTFVALSAADGGVQYTSSFLGNRAQHKVLVNGVLFAKNLADHEIVNAATAQPITSGYSGFNFGSGCGPISGSRDWFFGQTGGVADRLSPTVQSFPYRSLKADCSTPAMFSNGMFISPSSGCGCPDLHRGFIAAVPAGSFQFDRQAVEAERLEHGPAWGAITSTLTPGPTDWWTQRANNNRTGMVAVTLQTAGLHEKWRHTPARLYDTTTLDVGLDFRAEQEATPVVTAGGFAFWAGTDGYVRCHNGIAPVWSFPTGGRIYATPTVTGGCVYVGPADGYAYCIDAADGELVWRFRAAPVERRVNLYGYLASVWPVVTGVLVKDGRAYFGAGLVEEYGSHVYCVNASTGALLWQNNTCGPIYNATARLGFTPSGYMTVLGDRLWVRAHHGKDGVFNVNTGMMDSVPPALAGRNGGPTVRGKDIGIIDNQHMFRGGRLTYSDSRERGSHVRSLWYLFSRLDAQGVPQYPELQVSDWATSITPAWDSQNLYYTLSGEWFLEGWNTARLVQEIDSFQTAHDVATHPSDWPNWKEPVVQPAWIPGWEGNAPVTPMSVWRQTPPTDSVIDLRAMALTSNALVVTQARHHKWESSNWKWFLEVLDRSTGSRLWATRLACEPQWQGLSITRDGDMVVTLRTGEIVCYGAGTVSVAGRDPIRMPSAGASVTAVAGTWEAGVSAAAAATPDVSSSGPVQSVSPVQGAPRPLSGALPAMRQAMATRVTAGTLTAACRAEGHEVSPYAANAPARYRPADTRWKSDLPCLAVRRVSASSSAGAHMARNTTDRDLRTRWSPSGIGPQWIACDLGSKCEVSSLSLVWYGARGLSAALAVEVSADGAAYDRVDETTLAGRGTRTTMRTFLPASARYVRVTVTPVDGSPCPSVYEIGVHGAALAMGK